MLGKGLVLLTVVLVVSEVAPAGSGSICLACTISRLVFVPGGSQVNKVTIGCPVEASDETSLGGTIFFATKTL